jgi:hypothetical protein
MKANHVGRLAVLGLVLAAASCSSTVRQGTGTSFLIIESLEAASGADPDEFGATLHSDVITIVDERATVFNDFGRVRFSLGLKDPGSTNSPNAPSPKKVTPGVDVPYGFDGGMTVTVGDNTVEGAFQLVRHIAKQEAPLGTLQNGAVIISTIAEVTFFGRDQTGHEVTATGRISVDFGNFGDPQN